MLGAVKKLTHTNTEGVDRTSGRTCLKFNLLWCSHEKSDGVGSCSCSTVAVCKAQRGFCKSRCCQPEKTLSVGTGSLLFSPFFFLSVFDLFPPIEYVLPPTTLRGRNETGSDSHLHRTERIAPPPPPQGAMEAWTKETASVHKD